MLHETLTEIYREKTGDLMETGKERRVNGGGAEVGGGPNGVAADGFMIVSMFIQETKPSPFQLISVPTCRGSHYLINRDDVPLTINQHPEALSTVPVSAQVNRMFW